MAMEGGPMGRNGFCPCPHHRIVPTVVSLAVIIFGAAFFLNSLGLIGVTARETLWPLAIIIAGVAKLGAHWCRCCSPGGKCCH